MYVCVCVCITTRMEAKGSAHSDNCVLLLLFVSADSKVPNTTTFHLGAPTQDVTVDASQQYVAVPFRAHQVRVGIALARLLLLSSSSFFVFSSRLHVDEHVGVYVDERCLPPLLSAITTRLSCRSLSCPPSFFLFFLRLPLLCASR